MKIITYLGFTLISVLVQFCVMDYIQERLQLEEKPIIYNASTNRKLRDILQEYTKKPHALYYRTGLNRLTDYTNITSTTEIYSNMSLFEPTHETSSEPASTTFEELYHESASMTDIDSTTELFYTSTEIDNVTEFVLFEKKNKTQDHPKAVPKKSLNKEKCECNFLFNVCDIDCCCDSDCSDDEIKLFVKCIGEDPHPQRKQTDVCYPFFNTKEYTSNARDNFLCIVKTNLPEKRNINRSKYDSAFVSRSKEMTIKWRNSDVPNTHKEFMKKQYFHGDPIWLLKNGSIGYLDVSFPMVNNFCTGRKPVKFLIEERITCSIKLTHLEMIETLKTVDETSVISITDRSMNATVWDCSTLHCTKWNVIICGDTACSAYNRSAHEPSCTDSKCTYIALKIDYIFYYHDFKIVNATVKLYAQNVSMMSPYMTQEINIRFYLANTSIDEAVQFSGGPGYVYGLPVIPSFVESNHTDEFFNNMSLKKHLILPINENGRCVMSIPENTLQFGLNKRTKCRFSLEQNILSYNSTYACKMIYNGIYEYLGFNRTIFVSPTGNPHGLRDDEWLPLQIENTDQEIIKGEFFDGRSGITCHNIVTKLLLIFTYADKSNMDSKMINQILTASVEVTARNVSFYVEDFSTVLTIDTTFVDVTRPPVYEYAASPDINIHLPRDFFFPFPNNGYVKKCNLLLLICTCGAVFFIIK